MSVKGFIPDTPKEFAQIGMAISRLGTAMSAVLIFQASHAWVIGSLVLTWLGSELAQYFKLEENGKEDNKEG